MCQLGRQNFDWESGDMPTNPQPTEQKAVERPCIEIERDIRIALWNACCWQGKPQEVAQSFMRHTMEEPCMVKALDAVDDLLAARLDTRVSALVEALREIEKSAANLTKWAESESRDLEASYHANFAKIAGRALASFNEGAPTNG